MSTDNSLPGLPGNAHERAAYPLVSMVIPCYNHSAYVQQSIASIIAQDYENIELIIIDDGSTDDSVSRIEEMVAECQDRFVRFEFRVKANAGHAVAINEALEWCQGEYFAPLASDDVLMPQKTTVQMKNIHGQADVAGVFAGAEIIDSDGNTLGFMKPKVHSYTFDELYQRKMPISAPTQLVRTDLLRQVGGIAEGVYVEDWYMCLKLAHAGYTIKTVSEILVKYRRHGTNISNNGQKNFESRKYILNLYNKNRYYGKSMAAIHLMMAIDLSVVSKNSSIGYLFNALSYDINILLSFRFWYAVAKVLVPKSIFSKLSSMKKQHIKNNRIVRDTW